MNRGFTLLEVMFAVAIFTIVMGVLFGLSLGLSDSAGAQNSKMLASEESRRAMEVLLPHLRNASGSSLRTLTPAIPGNQIRFREAVQNPVTGKGVDAAGNITLGPVITVGPDTTDANGDGQLGTQLVMISQGAGGANAVRVLCNNLVPNPTAAIPSFWIAAQGNGFVVQIQNEGRDRRQRPFRTNVQVFFEPRN